ncbi:ABC transporter substrate-binding protein [Variovorax paradoxus]|nr:ABC transporter substrate-binding protein [Variovorax paradoxus]
MTMNRRQMVTALSFGAASLALPTLARSQANKTIKIIVGFAAGGAADVVARAVSDGLRSSGYTAIVDNKVGAGGRLAADVVLAAPTDGTTLLLTPSTNLTLYPHVYTNLRYEIKSFAAIGTACEFDFGLAVGASSTAKTLKEFLAQAKADPKLAAFGTPGAGTIMHFIGEQLAKQSGVPLLQVPYKGGAAALTDVIGGQVPSVITTLPNLIPMHKAGKVRILAMSGPTVATDLPDVPTFKSAGFPDLTVAEYFALFARQGTPKDVQAQLAAALNAAIATPTVKATLEKLNYQPKSMAPDALVARLTTDLERWKGVVKASGYTPES